MHSINKATNDLNNDSTKITKWTFQRTINFNLDICKQAHDVIFPAKKSIASHPPLTLSNISVAQTKFSKTFWNAAS